MLGMTFGVNGAIHLKGSREHHNLYERMADPNGGQHDARTMVEHWKVIDADLFVHRIVQDSPDYIIGLYIRDDMTRQSRVYKAIGYAYSDSEIYVAAQMVSPEGQFKAYFFVLYPCNHKYMKQVIGRCRSRHVCTKCGYEYIIDSSD